MSVLENIEPKRVTRFFEEISRIPRGSGNTDKISAWLCGFAENRGLRCIQDKLGNVIIFAPASKGYENAPTVIMQGHMDMVCEKLPSCPMDMESEGISLIAEDGFIRADGTTLGGDDGIALAIILAIIDSDDIPHPDIEAVFTIDEETGMDGAAGIDVSMLNGRIMLNLDSEDEGILTVSCAGGATVNSSIPIKRENISGRLCRIKIHSLKGGHSGVDINRGRANAAVLAGRLIYALRDTDFRLISVNSGSKNNVIPSEAVIEGVCRADIDFSEYERIFSEEYAGSDNIRICAEYRDITAARVICREDAEKISDFLMAVPNGVISMSREIEGLVKTSLNLGIVRTEDDYAEFEQLLRSSKESEKLNLSERLRVICSLVGADFKISGVYNAWEYRADSPLRDLMCRVFTEMYGYAPKIEAIHAGVECGIFAGKLDGLDCVSYGPDLLDIHSPRERMSIESVGRVWEFTKKVLSNIK